LRDSSSLIAGFTLIVLAIAYARWVAGRAAIDSLQRLRSGKSSMFCFWRSG